MISIFDTSQLLELFGELSEELKIRSEHAELFVVGGAAMALKYDAMRTTRDIDSVFEPTKTVREAAAVVARRHGLSEDWLNDGAKGFMPADPDTSQIVFETEWLRVAVASPEYLLAMKLFSARPERDIEDAVTLWKLAGYTAPEQGMELLERSYPARLLEPKHAYTVDAVADLASQS